MAESFTTRPSPLAYRVIKYWLPVVLMMSAMYYMSTDTFSGDNTRGLIEEIFAWLFSGANSATIGALNVIVRKAAHFTEYAVLAALSFRAFRADSRLRWRLGWAVYTLGIVVTWALLDEFHQAHTRTRGASIYDSMLDTAGGLFMLIAIAVYNRRRR